MTRAFVDMDGVLCDYYLGVCRALGVEPWPYFAPADAWNFFSFPPSSRTAEEVAPLMDHAFYAGLEWTPDGADVLAAAETRHGPRNVYLLTSPWETPGCRDGKAEWVARHLPRYRRRLLIGSPKEACAFPGAVLYDDSGANCDQFVAAGGAAVLVPRPWNARHELVDFATGLTRVPVSEWVAAPRL